MANDMWDDLERVLRPDEPIDGRADRARFEGKRRRHQVGFMSSAGGRRQNGSSEGQTLSGADWTGNTDERQKEIKWIGWGLVAASGAAGQWAFYLGESWMTRSPIFNAVGSLISLLGLLACWITGGLWWLVTANAAVCRWAGQLLPFGVQPFRSIIGILVLMVALAVAVRRFLPGSGLETRTLRTLRRLTWGAVCLMWIVALLAQLVTLVRGT